MNAAAIGDKIKHFIWLAIQWIVGTFFLLLAFGSLFVEDFSWGVLLTFLAIGCFSAPAIRHFFRAQIDNFSFEPLALNPFSKKHAFKKEMNKALEDGVLTEQEAADLEKTAEALGIKDSYVEKLRHKDFEGRIKPVIKRIEDTRRFSPDDERELKNIAAKLQVKGEFGPEFKMFRDLWEYENEGVFPLHKVDAAILLNKNEECYFEAPAIWKQVKNVKQYKGYAGGSVGFRVAKGVRFSVGRAVPVYDQYEEMRPISDGEIYVTNKKIIFNGSSKSTNITVGRIVQIELYQDGIEVRKTSGKPDFFQMTGVHAEYVSALIHNMMNNT